MAKLKHQSMKYFLFALTSLFIVACSSKQREGGKIEEDTVEQVVLETYLESRSGSFLIYYPFSEMEDSLKNKIVFPDLAEIKDTAYARSYFTGENEGALNREVLMLVGDYSSSSPKIWIDDNNDLKFTENEQFYTFSKDSLDFFIPNTIQSDLHFEYRIQKFSDSMYGVFNKDVTEYFTQGKHLGFYYEQRKNIKVVDFAYQGDSLRIGLYDSNCDGRFNSIDEDKIVFGDYGKEIFGTQEFEGALLLDTLTYFGTENFGFEIQEIAANGEQMRFKVVEKDTTQTRIVVGDKLSGFKLDLIEGGEIGIYDSIEKQQFIYLNFWSTGCAGCKKEMPDLNRLVAEYNDEVKLISINPRESEDRLTRFLDKYSINWTSTFASPEIIEALKVDGYPRNVLLDKDGVVLNMNIFPSQLIKKLEDGTLKQGV